MNIIGALDQPTDGQYLLDGECVGNLKDKQLSEIRNQKIGSVIAIMTVSSSLTTSIADSFQEMGANNITVGVKQSSEQEQVSANGMRFGTSGKSSELDEDDRITDEMIEGLQKQYSDQIDAIALSESVGRVND